MNQDGSGETILSSGTRDVFSDWSPDGAKILFTSARDGNWKIYVMDADGSNQTRITNDPRRQRNPVWSPDGREIAFECSREDGTRDIYMMNSDGSDWVNLTQGVGDNGWPSWSAK